jgi:hypothetical protein
MSPMLSLATDFWPVFWAIIGAGALVTVVLSVLIGAISPAGSRPHRGHRLALAPAEPTGPRAVPGYPAHRDADAA